MRVFSYLFILFFLIVSPYFIIHHQLPSRFIQMAALFVIMHLIALLIVHAVLPNSRKIISFYHTVFSIVLFAPIFYCSQVIFDQSLENIRRFYSVIPTSYLILLVTVIFSINFYKFNDSSK